MATRVLLVDDHEPWRRRIGSGLPADKRWQVVGEAGDGLEAIHLFSSLAPDLILLDVELPLLNGIEAARRIFALDSGAWVIDTPGMRELKVGAVQAGIESVFDNIEALAANCRFRNCRHESEAGCAVRAAIASGQLDERRLASYHKLQREAVVYQPVK